MASNTEKSGGLAAPDSPSRKHSDGSEEASKSEVERQTSDGGLFAADDGLDEATRRRLEASAKLENPLHGLTPEDLAQRGEEFCARHGIEDAEDVRAFRLGAVIAGNMNKFDAVDGLTDREREALDREITHKWKNPTMLYAVIVICSLCAAVQGMDETVVNGAQFFYKQQFGIGDDSVPRDTWLLGMVNGECSIQLASIFHLLSRERTSTDKPSRALHLQRRRRLLGY